MTTQQKGSPVAAEIKHRTIKTNGINMHIAEAGEGPLVLLVHGFPELWYSWRHQIPAIAEAGFHVVAPDVRGYGDSDKPHEIEAYAMKEHMADLLGILDEAGEKQAVIIGHDWGAPMAWWSAALYPDRYRAVAALSIPYLPRSPMPPLQMMKAMFQNNFFYILYFQEPGVAEAEFESDVDGSMRQFLWGASAEGRNIPGFANAMAGKSKDSKLFEGFPHMEGLPPWITEEEHAYYVEKFTKGGFRGPLNRYRNMDRDWEQLPELEGKRVEQPALFIEGDKDGAATFTPKDPMKQMVTNLKMVSLDAGHWTQQEKPAEVNAEIIAFLKSL
jgi:pimeloyl-ACP methyl ester carboxylesterase